MNFLPLIVASLETVLSTWFGADIKLVEFKPYLNRLFDIAKKVLAIFQDKDPNNGKQLADLFRKEVAGLFSDFGNFLADLFDKDNKPRI